MSENKEGKIIHSEVEISIDPNCTTAFMTITAPENGGLDITEDKVTAAVREKKIAFGLDEAALNDAVENKRYGENICIARWKPPVDGTDGKIEYFFNREQTFKPVEDENGNVDYKNLGLVRNIYRGTAIAKITPPTEGEAGVDIMGKSVRQRVGTASSYTIGKGTELTADGTQIIASVDGNLAYSGGAFCIEESLLIRGDVDVSSGNIDFIGDIIIKGNVLEGYAVSSKKNITVNGSVTNGKVTADGNITVKLGSINSELHSEKGNIKLDFCENSKLYAAGNIEANSFIAGEVFAGKCIIASGKGILLGGKYTALENITAAVIGSESYAKTLVTLGNNAVLSEEMEGHKRKIAEMEDKLDQLGKIVTALVEMAKVSKLPPQREQMKVEAMRSRFQMQGDIKRLNARIKEIETTLERKQDLSISCKKAFYPGVVLRINSCVYPVNVMTPHSKATIRDGEIVMVPL